MSDLVDPNKYFGPLLVPCAAVSLSGVADSSIWSTADYYQTCSPSHTAGFNIVSVSVCLKEEGGEIETMHFLIYSRYIMRCIYNHSIMFVCLRENI